MGYSLELVVPSCKPVDKGFICTQCNQLFKSPVLIDCGNQHIFCRKCINDFMGPDVLECPIDDNEYSCEEAVPQNFLAVLINQVKVRCEFHGRGCEEVLAYDKIEGHLLACKFKPSNEKICQRCLSAAGDHDCADYLMKMVASVWDEVVSVRQEVARKDAAIYSLKTRLRLAIRSAKNGECQCIWANLAREKRKRELRLESKIELKEQMVKHLQIQLSQVKDAKVSDAVVADRAQSLLMEQVKSLTQEIERLKDADKSGYNVKVKQLEDLWAKNDAALTAYHKGETEAKLGELRDVKTHLEAYTAQCQAQTLKIDILEKELQDERRKNDVERNHELRLEKQLRDKEQMIQELQGELSQVQNAKANDAVGAGRVQNLMQDQIRNLQQKIERCEAYKEGVLHSNSLKVKHLEELWAKNDALFTAYKEETEAQLREQKSKLQACTTECQGKTQKIEILEKQLQLQDGRLEKQCGGARKRGRGRNAGSPIQIEPDLSKVKVETLDFDLARNRRQRLVKGVKPNQFTAINLEYDVKTEGDDETETLIIEDDSAHRTDQHDVVTSEDGIEAKRAKMDLVDDVPAATL